MTNLNNKNIWCFYDANCASGFSIVSRKSDLAGDT